MTDKERIRQLELEVAYFRGKFEMLKELVAMRVTYPTPPYVVSYCGNNLPVQALCQN